MACNLAVISGMAFEAAMAQGSGIRTIYGLNPQRLENDITQAIGQGVKGLISFGTAAGLLAGLAPGTIIVARTVLYRGEAWRASDGWSAQLCAGLPAAQPANVAGLDKPLQTAAQKSLVHSKTGAAVVDMESHRVARLAHRHGLPFAAVRVVLDAADRALPPAALEAARGDGSISYAGLVRSLLHQPRQCRLLAQLAADHRKAKPSLLRCGAFLRSFAMEIG